MNEGVVLWEENIAGEVRGRRKTAERASTAQKRREEELVAVKWTGTVYDTLKELRLAGGVEATRNLKTSMAMRRVVKEETELAEEERRVREREKRRMIRARKREKSLAADSPAPPTAKNDLPSS
jgi:hypothetical protein